MTIALAPTQPALTQAQLDALADELDALRTSVVESLGEADARYIRAMIATQRWLEIAGRVVIVASRGSFGFVLGTAGLATAKILENMEIGHNVLHGQWDWMRDPKIHSTTWEWDSASPAAQWKRTHNEVHHVYTNVLGHDTDLGYGVMRVRPEQPWTLGSLAQPVTNLGTALIFEQGIAMYDLGLNEQLKGENPRPREEFMADAKAVLKKVGKQALKDYVLHPLVSGPKFRRTAVANLLANTIRNVWAHSVIMCGHFPAGAAVFEAETAEDRSRGAWYLRQMLGSANISGGPLMHVMTGNLDHQIEHHLFPDLPSNRYAEIAPRVRAIFERYGLPYASGPLHRQVASAWLAVLRLSLPNAEAGRSRARIVADAAREQVGRALRPKKRRVSGSLPKPLGAAS